MAGATKRSVAAAADRVGLFVLVGVFAAGGLSIAFAATGVADRVEATGLMLVTLATVFVTPALFSLDALAKLDEWWFSTELPAHQLAFAEYFRKIVRMALRLALIALSDASALVVLVWSFSVSVTAAIIGAGLRLIVGSPGEGPPEPIVTAPVSEFQRDPERQRRNTRLAALFLAAGTVLSFVAVVFLH